MIMLSILEKIQSYKILIRLFIFSILIIDTVLAAEQTVNLSIGYKTVNFADKPIKALAINDQIPGPTLHFKEGDTITLNVLNNLNEGTTIHWHGLLVPWDMDGVENVSQDLIPPGGQFQYKFQLKQSGTYWYHAHAGFQEQQGVYGGIIIDPLVEPSYTYKKDFVIVLSDWSNTSPTQIYANLKKDGDYYSPKFPMQPSLVRFIEDYTKASLAESKQILDDYFMMQHMRMSIYDFSDVAYDAFLLNGRSSKKPWTAPVKVGDIVRLRFIGAGASTNFRVKIPNTNMQVIHVQGNDVEPYNINDFTITPGETIDVLVSIQKEDPYIIYAESSDTLGSAVGALVPNFDQKANYKVQPFPTPMPVTEEMRVGMMGQAHESESTHSSSMNMDGMMAMEHAHSMKRESTTYNLTTKGTKYQNLKALYETNDPDKPVEIISMTLSGYMDRYIWFINGLPEYKSMPILIEPGKRYRLIFFNDSMMHHPMHIHGHFFILRNGHGAYDPLLHTIDVPPGTTVVADFDAKESGQWLFHCHNLYHMMAGMSHIFRYSTFDKEVLELHSNVKDATHMFSSHPQGHSAGLFAANYLEMGEDPFHDIQKISLKSLFGSDYNKLQISSEDIEVKKGKLEQGDVDIFYWRLISEFWAIKGGFNYFYRPSKTPYWQPGLGIEGLMPYFIGLDAKAYYHQGSFKVDTKLGRDTQITNNFFIRLGIEGIIATKTLPKAEIGSGLNQISYTVRPFYRMSPNLIIFSEFEHSQIYGKQKQIFQNEGESTRENSLVFGVSFLF